MVTYICTLCILLSQTVFAAAAAAEQPVAPAQQPPQQAPQNMEPSQEDMDAMMDFINQLSPEEQQELEELGREIINNMSDEELQELADMFGTTVEELREDAQKPPEKPQPAAPAKKPEPEKPASDKEKKETYISEEKARQLIMSAITLLESIIQKADQIPDEINKLAGIMKEAQDIVYYLKIIREKGHIKRLASVDYKDIINTLEAMVNNLQQLEPRIAIPDEEEEATAYDVLGVKPGASQEDIEQAYENLQQQYAPEYVEKRLQEQGVPPRQIRSEKREAELTFANIREAYTQLQDPKMRKQIERKQEAQKRQKQATQEALQTAQNEVVKAITTAVYNNKLIENIESFLKAYEPQELEKKKQMEQAEKQRREEQKRRAQERPAYTPGGRLEPGIQPAKRPQEPRKTAGAPGAPGTQPGRDEQPKPGKEDERKQQDKANGKGPKADQKEDTTQPDKKQKDTKKADKDKDGKTADTEKEQQALQMLQSDLKKFADAYETYKQTFTNVQTVAQALDGASSVNTTQEQQLENIDTELQSFADQAQLDQLASRTQQLARDLGDLSQKQRTTWSQNVTPKLNQIKEAKEALKTAQEHLNNAPSNQYVTNVISRTQEVQGKLSTVESKLQNYSNLVREEQPMIQTYTSRISNIINAYSNTPRVANITNTINQIATQPNTTATQNQANNLNNDLNQVFTYLDSTEEYIGAETLSNMIQDMGMLTSEQQNQWKKGITQQMVTNLENMHQALTDALNTLNNNLSSASQNLSHIANLMQTLNTYSEKLRHVMQVVKQKQQEVQQTGSASTGTHTATSSGSGGSGTSSST